MTAIRRSVVHLNQGTAARHPCRRGPGGTASADIRIAVARAAVLSRLRSAARRREWRVAGSGAAVCVPERGATAVPIDGKTETAR